MIKRLQKLNKSHSLFLFGARGTGKSTLIQQLFPQDAAKDLWIDLLSEHDEERFGRHPDELSLILESKKYRRVIVDEVQKAPKILDIVHREIERHKGTQFILTGSSARKLKRGAANLLAGRAFTYHLYPMSFIELGAQFDLRLALQFGTLPEIFNFKKKEEKAEYLRGYTKTYLKEEIQVEQVVRNLAPFRDFLEIAAQGSGKIINFSKISRDIGVDDKTVHSYYQILEDTLVGFFLPPFHRSIRKRQREAPKFYLFDAGVKRALDRTLKTELTPQTYAFGEAFEHLVISELHWLNEYLKADFRFSYLRTKDGAEVDVVVERPGEPDVLLEIKSATHIGHEDTRSLRFFSSDWDRPVEAKIWSLDKTAKKDGSVECQFWQDGLKEIFNL